MATMVFTKEEWMSALKGAKDAYRIFLPVKHDDYPGFELLSDETHPDFEFQNTRNIKKAWETCSPGNNRIKKVEAICGILFSLASVLSLSPTANFLNILLNSDISFQYESLRSIGVKINAVKRGEGQ